MTTGDNVTTEADSTKRNAATHRLEFGVWPKNPAALYGECAGCGMGVVSHEMPDAGLPSVLKARGYVRREFGFASCPAAR